MKLYGIPNCSTVRRARAWLEEREIPYEFHDLKKDGVPVNLMSTLCDLLGWESIVNRNGQTWRKLDNALKTSITDSTAALALMQAHASVIKRPILDCDGQYQVGFSEENYAAFLGE
jgi:arsenate reductase